MSRIASNFLYQREKHSLIPSALQLIDEEGMATNNRTNNRLRVQKPVARFMTATSPIGAHLMAGKPLTEVELDFIVNTCLELQTAIEVWRRKKRLHSKASRRSLVKGF